MRDRAAQAGCIALMRVREPQSSMPFLPACRNQALRRNDRRIAPEICTLRQSRLHRHSWCRRAQSWLGRDEAKYRPRSEEHTSELQSLMRISYAVFCLKKKNKNKK